MKRGGEAQCKFILVADGLDFINIETIYRNEVVDEG
jgi:hypothetical protein